MEVRDGPWEDHVNRLTRQVRSLLEENNDLVSRIDYLEGVVLTLIVALKKGGILIPDENGEHEFENNRDD